MSKRQEKIKAQNALRFPIAGYDYYPTVAYRSRSVLPVIIGPPSEHDSADPEGPPADKVINVFERQYLVREAFGTVFFRDAARNEEAWTYFLFASSPRTAIINAEWLGERIDALQYGRVAIVLYEGGPDACFVLFRPDGKCRVVIGWLQGDFEGFNLTEHFPNLEWSFPDQRQQIDVLTLDPQELLDLAVSLLDKEVNHRIGYSPLAIPFRMQPEPVEFICGSQKELVQVTIWIIQADPLAFPGENVKVFCHALGDWGEYLKPGLSYQDGGQLLESSQTLLELAFEYNAYTGGHWEYNDQWHSRADGYDKYPNEIIITVSRPTPEEMTKAKLNLAAWLQGKVTEQERERLLVTLG